MVATLDHDPIRLNRIMISSLCLSMISAQTLCVCREGKPVPTFPDHALETNGFSIHALLSGRQINRMQQPIGHATVFVARTGSLASSVEPQQQQLQPLHAFLAKAAAQPSNSANPSLNKSGFTVGIQGTSTPRPSRGCQSGVRRQSSGVMRHPLEHVGYLAKPLDLVRIFCHRGREAIMFGAFEKVGGQVRGMRNAQFALLVSH